MTTFEGDLFFYSVDETPPPARDSGFQYEIDPYNAPYLAGKTIEPSHGLVELTAEEALGIAPSAVLPSGWSESDTLKVIGNIDHSLRIGDSVMVAHTSNFKQASELAERIGYRPAFAGEFLQLLWFLLQSCNAECEGWFYCYAGRKPGYAILADYYYYRRESNLRIIFDTHIGNLESIDSNADNHCFFVKNC